jgi:DNA polymerase-3 subunit epsilon
VLAHFASGLRSEKETRLAREVRRIEWRRTVGELGALLLEARLVKELAPLYNRQLRRPDGPYGFVFDGTRLRIAESDEIDAETLSLVRGVFRSKRAALAALRVLAEEHRLCLQTLGFEVPARRGPCFRHQLGRCAGVCAGKENVHLHLARVGAALTCYEPAAWPHRGPVGIVERDRSAEATEVHVVDRWCYLGAAASDAEVAELLEARRGMRFDYDQYRILARHLGRRGVRVVELAG